MSLAKARSLHPILPLAAPRKETQQLPGLRTEDKHPTPEALYQSRTKHIIIDSDPTKN